MPRKLANTPPKRSAKRAATTASVARSTASSSKAAPGRTRTDRPNPAAVLLAQAKRRAKQGGIPFNIGLEDISIPGLCPALKIPLFPGRKKVGRNSPSLDRLVPELGYTKGNVVVISHRANTLKNDATPVELEAIASWLRTAIRP